MKKAFQIILYAAAALSIGLVGLELFFWLRGEGTEDPWKWIIKVLGIVQLIAVGGLILYQVYTGRQPTKTYAWVLLLLLLPPVGIVLYVMFGWNYRKEKHFSEKQHEDRDTIEKLLGNGLIVSEQEAEEAGENLPWKIKKNIALLQSHQKAWLFPNNDVTIFTAGADLYPKMLEDIDRAENHVHCEFFAFEHGKLGNKFKAAFEQAIERGVEIRILYDSIGNRRAKNSYLQSLRELGCEVVSFMPVRFPNFNSRFNYRNHRKIMVVDGKLGYTGGFNVGDNYWWGVEGIGRWRDTQLRIEGEAVHGLQTIFLTDWRFMEPALEIDDHFFPEIAPSESCPLQLVASGPDTEQNGILDSMLNLISTARQYVYITSPYLIPPDSIISSLIVAARAGIDVRLLIPKRSDMRVMDYTNKAFVQELLEAKIRVYFYEAGMIHAKVLIADDNFASVGSANLDVRSLEQNFEMNTLIYECKLVEQLRRQFEQDLEESEEQHLVDYKNRSIGHKVLEGIARLFAPLL